MRARGEDRRRAPRRAEDAREHYSREALIGAALAYADGGSDAEYEALFSAAANYRAAVERTIPSWS